MLHTASQGNSKGVRIFSKDEDLHFLTGFVVWFGESVRANLLEPFFCRMFLLDTSITTSSFVPVVSSFLALVGLRGLEV